MNLKLNLKRTFLIGFAFFGILLLWQVYDSWCPTMLTEILTAKMPEKSQLEVQWIVGIIMACDNLAALILLPIFGTLSDKTHTKIGKRMPYILTGTLVAAFAFPLIPVFFHTQHLGLMVAAMGIVLVFMMMYRNPAVALMPDITPKPLRAKANGIINIMGYIGGAFATVLGIVWSVSSYINPEKVGKYHNFWVIFLPFLVASILMVISAFVLFFKIKENKLAVELKEELEEGERQAAIKDKIEEDKPLSKANKTMLWGILIAEFLWFMADNAVGTYLVSYIIYHIHVSSGFAMILTIIMGVGSVFGFAIAGGIADKIGRKWTITLGLSITVLGYIMFTFVAPSTTGKLPLIFYFVYLFKGFGMSLVHNCSFPMVVELSSQKTIGKFTGFYYTASMSAQTITPILLGLLFLVKGEWGILPWYGLVLMVAALVVFTVVVKNIKASKVENVKGLEAIGGDD